jgi:endoglycosylceramidase
MWSGLVPSKDKINETYLNEIIQIVHSLASNKIYVIIDLHQDMMSSKFSSYDGVPLWILESLPNSRFNFPWPISQASIEKSAFAAYLTEACGFAFQCLYDNVSHFGDHFQFYWSVISKTFANTSSVLGYELLNEPWPGDIYADPLRLIPGVGGRENLMPLYDRTSKTIRQFDNESLIFYEPVTWSVMSSSVQFGTGFDHPPGNDSERTVLSWHYYCWLTDFFPFPLDPIDKKICDQVQLTASFEAVNVDMLSLGNGPSFLTEFGECSYTELDDPNKLNTNECDAVINAADKYLVSWCYWDSIFYFDNLTIDYRLVDTYSRVYPVYTNGIPIALHFNITTKRFVYYFEMSNNGDNDGIVTEISIPKHIYSFLGGFDGELSSDLKSFYNSQLNILIVSRSGKNLTEKYSKIVIFPKNKFNSI